MSQVHPINTLSTLQYLKSFTETVENLSNPLQQHGIKFFSYARVYRDNRAIFLCNSNDWYDIKFNRNLFDYNGFITINSLYRNGFTKSLFKGQPPEDIKVLYSLYHLDFWNSLDLYRYNEDYVTIFNFSGSRSNEEMINFYMNNIQSLEIFAHYFEGQISKLIETEQDKMFINIGPCLNKVVLQENEEVDLIPAEMKRVSQAFQVNNQEFSFSQRQIQCLALILKGCTAKEIGKALSLSYRTVETYLILIKRKFGLNTTREVCNFIARDKGAYDFLNHYAKI